jgi:hypothetical protein
MPLEKCTVDYACGEEFDFDTTNSYINWESDNDGNYIIATPNDSLQEALCYVYSQVTNCEVDSEGHWESEFASGTHIENGGSMNYTQSGNEWGGRYSFNGEVGCIGYDQTYTYYGYGGEEETYSYYAQHCWDTLGLCGEDAQIEETDDENTVTMKQSYNNNTRITNGGGSCYWYSYDSSPSESGDIDLITGKGYFSLYDYDYSTYQSSSTIYEMEDYVVVSVEQY